MVMAADINKRYETTSTSNCHTKMKTKSLYFSDETEQDIRLNSRIQNRLDNIKIRLNTVEIRLNNVKIRLKT